METNSFSSPVFIFCEKGPEALHLPGGAGLLLLTCREGQAEYRLRGQSVPFQPGDILLLPPGEERGSLFPTDARYRHIAIDISETAAKTLETLENQPLPAALLHSGYYRLRTAGTRWEHLAAFPENMYTEAERHPPGWNTMLYGSTFVLLTLLARATLEKSTLMYGQNNLLEQILQYVEQNMAQKITLTDTAHRFLVSESTISKLFRSRMNASFYHYVIQRRLKAAQLLIAGGHPLEHVYAQVGFCDHAAFYRAFKRAYGISPKQYKNSLAAPEDT